MGNRNCKPMLDKCAQVKRAVKEEVLKPRYRTLAVESSIGEVLMAHGLESQISNSMHNQVRSELGWLPSGCLPTATVMPIEKGRDTLQKAAEELDAVIDLRQRWGKKLTHDMRKLSEEAGQPLMRVRQEGDIERYQKVKKAMSIKGQNVKLLYEAADLLEALTSTRHPNGSRSHLPWGICPLRLRIPTLKQLRERYADLAPSERQTGIDDEILGWFEEERHAECQRLLAHGYTPLLEQYAKRGVPSGLRARVWLGILRLSLGEREYNYCADLQVRTATMYQKPTSAALPPFVPYTR